MSAIMLRRATQADTDMLFAWRNNVSDGQITREEHERWMKFSVEQGYPTHIVLVAETDKGTAGIVGFEADRHDVMNYKVWIIVAPHLRKKGLGQRMLDYACHHMCESTIFAHINHENKAAITIFERAGFEPHDDDGEYLIYRRGPTS